MTGWDEAVDGLREWLCASGCTALTVKIRSSYVRRLGRLYPDRSPWALTLDDLVAFLAYPGWAGDARNSARASVRALYRWGIRTGRLTEDPTMFLPSVHVPAGKPRPAPDLVFSQAMLRAGTRETAMLLLAAYAGLRRSEIAKVHSDDIIAGELRVLGKGNKVRIIPLHPQLAAVLADFPCGYVFPGRINGHLSPDHVGELLTRLLGPGWSAHTLRHRFATRSYAAQRDLRAVQELLGHSKPETTARYTAVPNDALRLAVLGAA